MILCSLGSKLFSGTLHVFKSAPPSLAITLKNLVQHSWSVDREENYLFGASGLSRGGNCSLSPAPRSSLEAAGKRRLALLSEVLVSSIEEAYNGARAAVFSVRLVGRRSSAQP